MKITATATITARHYHGCNVDANGGDTVEMSLGPHPDERLRGWKVVLGIGDDEWVVSEEDLRAAIHVALGGKEPLRVECNKCYNETLEQPYHRIVAGGPCSGPFCKGYYVQSHIQ